MSSWYFWKTIQCHLLVAAIVNKCLAANLVSNTSSIVEFVQKTHANRRSERYGVYGQQIQYYSSSLSRNTREKTNLLMLNARSKRNSFLFLPPFDDVNSTFDDFNLQIAAIDSIYCGKLCALNFPQAATFPNNLCATCYCDALCQTYGDCCVDLVLLQNFTQTTSNMGCESSSVKTADNFYMMVNACPGSQNHTAKDRCSQPNVEEWLSNIPVTSNSSGKTYRNIHCAFCHGVYDVVRWKTEVNCNLDSTTFANTSSVNNIYWKAVHDPGCEVRFIPQQRQDTRYCSEVDKDVIQKCNVSGRWQIYDENVEKACASYRNIVRKKYWNIFCYFCNINVPWFIVSKEQSNPENSAGESSLTVLLQVEDESERSGQSSYTSQCSTEEIFDPYKEICRHMGCPHGKQLQNHSCSSVVTTTNIYSYRLCLLVNIPQQCPLTAVNVSQMANNISQYLTRHIPEDALFPNISLDILDLKDCVTSEIPILWMLKIYLFSPRLVDRDDFETELVAIPRHMRDDLSQIYNGSDIVVISSCDNEFQDPILKCMKPLTTYRIIFTKYLSDPLKTLLDHLTVLDVNALLICPHITLHADEVIRPTCNLTNSNSAFSLNTKANNKTVGSDSYIVLGNSSIVLCARSYIDQNISDGSDRTLMYTLNIVYIICTSVSLLFLSVSFVIYCLFPALRTSGGVSNMGLIVTLFVAQTLFQFCIRQTEVYTLCIAIGMSVHLFWLASVWWMNAIILYLFYTLCFPLQSMAIVRAVRKVFLMSLLYSYGCSAAVVMITIIASLAMFGDTGYGTDICYLKRDSARKFAFSLPIGILVFTNIVLFVITMRKLRRRTSICSSNEHRISMIACVKLSATTGLSWVNAFLYLSTKLIAFSVAFSMLVSLQGLLLFLAFLANRRVWSLFQNRSKQTQSQRTTTSTPVTITNSHL